MFVNIPIKEPKVGMQVQVTNGKCCFGHPKGETGRIVNLLSRFDFVVRDWADRDEAHCIQCCKEVKEVL